MIVTKALPKAMAEPAGSSQPRQYQSLQAGRGIAALLVVLFHASGGIFPAAKYWNVQLFGGVFNFGYAGVEFFFVLSGFIIAHAHAADVGRPDRLRRYAWRRFIRIYPAYWIVLAGLLFAAIVLKIGDSNAAPAPPILLWSTLLVGPTNQPSALAVAWTLFHEIAFYAAFALWIVAPRLGLAVAVAWGIGIVGGLIGDMETTVGVTDGELHTFYWLSPLNFLFLFGIAARQAALWDGWRWPGLWAAAGAALFVGTGMENLYFPFIPDMTRTLVYGAASALAIAGAAASERQRGWAVPGWLLLLGAASYSIYLVHFPLLSLIAKLFGLGGLRHAIPAPLAFFIVVGLAVAGGIGFHLLIERPILRRLGSTSPAASR